MPFAPLLGIRSMGGFPIADKWIFGNLRLTSLPLPNNGTPRDGRLQTNEQAKAPAPIVIFIDVHL